MKVLLKLIVVLSLFSGCSQTKEQVNYISQDSTLMNYGLIVNPDLKIKDLSNIQCVVDGPEYEAGVNFNFDVSNDSILTYQDFATAVLRDNKIQIHLGGCYSGLVGRYIDINILDSTFLIEYTYWTDVGDMVFKPLKQKLVLSEFPFEFGNIVKGKFEFDGLSHSKFGSQRSSVSGYFEVEVVGDTTYEYHNIPEDPNEYQFVRKFEAEHYNTELDVEELLKLTQLKELDLSAVKKLPSDFTSLHNLRSLKLWDNNLTEPPKGLDKLKKLEILNLRRNKLITYQFLSSLNNLKELNLAQTGISSIPDQVFGLKELRTLTLDGFKSDNIDAEIRKLKSLPNLRELGLRYCDLKTLPKSIAELDRLTVLHLSENPMSDEELNNIKCQYPNLEINFMRF